MNRARHESQGGWLALTLRKKIPWRDPCDFLKKKNCSGSSKENKSQDQTDRKVSYDGRYGMVWLKLGKDNGAGVELVRSMR